MPRTVTVTFNNGRQHVYNNVPDDVTPDQIEKRAASEFGGLKITKLDGGAKAPAAPKSESLKDWATRKVAVASDALAPYTTAATLGAAAGAPFAGVGAGPGAALALTGLGLGDLAYTGYNALAGATGLPQATLPSENIRNIYRQQGLTQAPKTTGERILHAGISGAAGGFGGAVGAQQAAGMVANPVVRNVLAATGEQPVAQAAAGGGAAASGQTAAEAKLPWWAQYGASLAGGMAAGRKLAAKPAKLTSEDVRQRASKAYTTAEESGVTFEPSSVAKMGQDIRSALSSDPKVQFHPKLHSRIETALNEIETAAKEADATGKPMSFSRMEILRRLAKTAGNSTDADERRLARIVVQKLDDFVAKPPPGALLAGDHPGAVQAIQSARKAWAQAAQADILDNAISKAKDARGGLTAEGLQTQFKKIADRPAQLRQFSPEAQKAIKDLAGGKNGVNALQVIANLAPGLSSWRGRSAAAVEAGMLMAHPVYAGLAAGSGVAARAGANRLAASRANALVDTVRGTPRIAMPINPMALTLTRETAIQQENNRNKMAKRK